MKNNIIIFFLGLILFLFISRQAFAQQSDILVPGINCGVAGDIKTSKCCAPNKFEFFRPPDLGFPINAVLDIAKFAAQGLLNNIMNPLDDLQRRLIIACDVGVPSTPNDPTNINCRCELTTSPPPASLTALKDFCDNQTSSFDKSNCSTCIKGGGVWTGIGCVEGNLSSFIGKTIFGFGIGLAGGLALLCIIYSAFMMQSSQGNPERLKKSQEMLTSCIMGLMLIIFSIFILRLIGVNILKIPGFS